MALGSGELRASLSVNWELARSEREVAEQDAVLPVLRPANIQQSVVVLAYGGVADTHSLRLRQGLVPSLARPAAAGRVRHSGRVEARDLRHADVRAILPSAEDDRGRSHRDDLTEIGTGPLSQQSD